MRKFIFSDILWGTALTLAALFSYFTGSGLETAELKFYDFRARLSAPAQPKSDIAVIEINDDSISKIGRWPWPRSKIADMLVWLSSAPARPSVIGLDILYSEPEKNGGMTVAEKLKAEYSRLVAEKKIRETGKGSDFLKTVDRTERDMDDDARLADAEAQAGNVVLPFFFDTGVPTSRVAPAPDWMKKFSPELSHKDTLNALPVQASGLTAPIEVIASSAAGAGHVNVFGDIDGSVRREYPFIPYGQNIYPSFASEIVRVRLGLAPGQETFIPGNSVRFGRSVMPLDQSSTALLSFNKRRAFKYYSFYDVLNGKIVPEAFKDKIVLIGLTAQGIGSLYVTPTDSAMPAVDYTANVVDDILSGRFISRPDWAGPVELGLVLLAGIFTAFLLPRLKAGSGALLAGGLFAALVAAGIYLFVAKGLWIKIMYPSFVLVAGYIFVVTKRFFTTEKKKELIEVSQIETNKMLGLSFQGQGMLDLAFEKFRLCPLDENMKDTLYNLALDFERKRQYNKAAAVYEHISARDPGFKDIRSKIDLLKQASNGAVFGGLRGKAGGAEATMMVAGSSTTPTLGRYEIKKELGKGAMGIVYLGVDPKINRTVAIKTMRFEEGLDEKAMKDLKDRFFREAQAAGNLTHPNIVKIYDAGEEQDIAYIAMELLKGDDLKKWAAKGNLLPVPKVLEYVAHAADALAYAHKNGIVHRDIKPANIMLLEDGTIRVADFGIARIAESSKTATGTVLGTPYYMSPEQIAGKKVDGRADIFSLGVTLYELLTGEKPWKGGESIGTLLFQITSDPYPDPLDIRPDLPGPLLAVIDKALRKKPEERFQTAAEIAEALRTVLAGGTPQINDTPAQARQTRPAAQPVPPQQPAAAPHPAQTQTKPAPARQQPAAVPHPVQTQSKPAPATHPAQARQINPAPAAVPVQTQQAKTAAQPPAGNTAGTGAITQAGRQSPDGLELPPRAGAMNAGAAGQKPAPKPAEKPQPRPAPQPAEDDFDSTLPVIFPDEDKK